VILSSVLALKMYNHSKLVRLMNHLVCLVMLSHSL